MTTLKNVPISSPNGKRAGYAAPGWEWRIVRVYAKYVGAGMALEYECVAHTAPLMYNAHLRPHTIDKKVGRHAGLPFAKPEKTHVPVRTNGP